MGRSEETRTSFSGKTNKTEKLLVTISFSKRKKNLINRTWDQKELYMQTTYRDTPKNAKMEFIILYTNLEK